MMNLKLISQRFKNRNQEGFSLAELSVGMFIGVIVFTIAVGFLVSFSSASYQASAKKQVSIDARTALTRALKDIGGAASMPTCAQYKDRVSNDASLANPVDYLKNNPTKCAELVNTGNVLAQAKANAICWYKSDQASNKSVSIPVRVACMFRGDFRGDSLCNDPSQINYNTIYYIECQNNSSYTAIAGTDRVVVNLGVHSPSIPGMFAANARTFSYVNYDASNTFNILKISKVIVNASMSYETGQKRSDGFDQYGEYKFSQTISLQGMKAFVETGAYGN